MAPEQRLLIGIDRSICRANTLRLPLAARATIVQTGRNMNERWTHLLNSQGARFADGRVVAYANPPLTSAVAADAAVCDLSHYGVMEVAGEDAAKFLQGQFTNDVQALQDGQAQWNGWCSPKGRLIVTFLLWRGGGGIFCFCQDRYFPQFKKDWECLCCGQRWQLATPAAHCCGLALSGQMCGPQLTYTSAVSPIQIFPA